MKILIAYATHSGNSREMAELLASLLPNHNVTLTDIAKQDSDPQFFDYVVLGGSVHAGRMLRAVRRYVKRHAAVLSEVPHSLFVVSAAADQFENYAERSIPEEVLTSAEQCVYFGGELKPEKVRGFSRLIVRFARRAITKSEEKDAALPGLLPEHVRLLAEFLRAK